MNQNKPCEVKDCTGSYQESIIGYCNLMLSHTDFYRISVEDYYKLESKRGYHPIIACKCDKCDDDLDKRLVEFCRNLKI